MATERETVSVLPLSSAVGNRHHAEGADVSVTHPHETWVGGEEDGPVPYVVRGTQVGGARPEGVKVRLAARRGGGELRLPELAPIGAYRRDQSPKEDQETIRTPSVEERLADSRLMSGTLSTGIGAVAAPERGSKPAISSAPDESVR